MSENQRKGMQRKDSTRAYYSLLEAAWEEIIPMSELRQKEQPDHTPRNGEDSVGQQLTRR